MTSAQPSLDVRANGQRLTVAAGTTLVIGREGPTTLRLSSPLISRRHLVLWFDGVWRMRSDGTNGTFCNGRRVDELEITQATRLRLGDVKGPELELVPQPASQLVSEEVPAAPSVPPAPPEVAPSGLSVVHRIAHSVVTVGRTPDNTVVLDDLLVSRHHAELRLVGDGWWLRDLGSANGTYVDGRRIAFEQIAPNNLIGIGHQTFHLRDGRLEEYRDSGAVTFEARELVVTAGGRRLLDGVSFELAPNSMLLVVGPSGSGKSTLLKALTGAAPASSGSVGYGGRDLYSNYDEIRHRLGFVPQDDILHPQLRVRDALDYAGQLRFPQDVDAAQRGARVREVISEMGLDAQANQRVSTLSGGQRKRTSAAMELLTGPSLLFLDEPTSGLDKNREREVMRILRALASAGRTVIVVSHSVDYLELADRILVLATGGHLAYYGVPAQALGYFGLTDYADVYAALEQPRPDWRQRFEQSPFYTPPAHRNQPMPVTGKSQTPQSTAPNRQQRTTSQFATLCRRYAAVIAADRAFVVLTVAMPLVLALFAHLVPDSAGLSFSTAAQDVLTHSHASHSPAQLLLVLILGGCLIGSASAVREIVKERPIFERERAIGLSWQAYLASKVAVLGVICSVQAIVLTLLAVAGRPGPDSGAVTSHGTLELVIAMILVTVASMALGLILSALVTNADRVMPLLVVVIMAQLLMTGGLFPVRHRIVLEQLSWLSPARWGFAAAASVVNLANATGITNDPLWKHDGAVFIADIGALIVLTAIYLAIIAVLLRRIGRLRTPRVR